MAKQAIAAIRRQRLGPAEPDRRRDQLHRTLVRAINAHLKRYPDTTDEEIEEALYLTSAAVASASEA